MTTSDLRKKIENGEWCADHGIGGAKLLDALRDAETARNAVLAFVTAPLPRAQFQCPKCLVKFWRYEEAWYCHDHHGDASLQELRR